MAIQWSGWMRYVFGGLWNPEKGQQSSGPNSYGNDSLQPVSDDRALQIGAVFRSIRILAETAALLPMVAYKKLPNGDREPLPESHWLTRIIAEPNETMTGDEWRESMYAQMAGWGNGYSQIVRQSEGRPVELWPYKVANMDVQRREDRSLLYRYPNMYGSPQDLPAGKVLHLRAFSVDGVMGLSPLGLARQAMGLAIGAERYAASFFAQGGRPAGIMTSDKLLTDAQRVQIRKEFGGIANGGEDSKRFWVLEGSLKYTPITVSPEDMQMLQTRSFSVADIARFFGVPLFLLMETTKDTSWGSGLEQQNLGFLVYALRPYYTRMVATFNRFIIPEAERPKICVDIDETPLLTLDSAAQKEFYSSMTSNALMTRNEARRRLKMPRSTETNSDKLTCQSALVPLETLGTVARPAPGNPGSAPDTAQENAA